jgi:hypothetical protein
LYFEVFGRHLLEDLGPLVTRDVGEVLLLPLLHLLQTLEASSTFFATQIGLLVRSASEMASLGRESIVHFTIADLEIDEGEVGVVFEVGHFDALDGGVEVADDALQQIVRHRPGHLDAFELRRHGGGFEEADPDGQIQLVVGVLEMTMGVLVTGSSVRPPTVISMKLSRLISL